MRDPNTYDPPGMSTPELIKLNVEILGELTKLGEALTAKTDRGRELQSLYFANTYHINMRGKEHRLYKG